MRSFKSAVAATLALGLLTSAAFAATKQYQVTGKLTEVSDKKLVIDKGDEKWEIERSSDLKIEGKLEVGQKVTIYYHMIADKIDKK